MTEEKRSRRSAADDNDPRAAPQAKHCRSTRARALRQYCSAARRSRLPYGCLGRHSATCQSKTSSSSSSGMSATPSTWIRACRFSFCATWPYVDLPRFRLSAARASFGET